MAVKKTVDDIDMSVDLVEESVAEAGVKPAKVVAKAEVKPKKKYRNGDYVLCHSVTPGGLSISSKSGNYYEFKRFGAECEIEYHDLVMLVRKGSDHLFLPRIVIDEDDFVQEFPQLVRAYNNMYTQKDLQEILTLPDAQMKREIEKLPEQAKKALRNIVSTDISKGKIDSVRKIRTLSEVFNSDFNLLSELFNR